MYIEVLCLLLYSICKGTCFRNNRRDLPERRLRMDPNVFVNALFLCVVNALFMVAGIFLNSVVIISLWRSSQLRKKLCYFTILVLSCVDLIVVTVAHPALILWTIFWYRTSLQQENKFIWQNILGIALAGFSMFALLTLSVERFLALKYPFFHQTAVTKRRLMLLLAFLMIMLVSLSPLVHFVGTVFRNMFVTVFLVLIFFVFIYLNYKMFIIAKSKRNMNSVASTSTVTRSYQERKRRKMNFNNISTCSLAVGCFFVCSSPHIIYSVLSLTSETLQNDRLIQLFNIWSNTLVFMNSTFNCLIFFWRNSILRREGIKILKWGKSKAQIESRIRSRIRR